MVVMIVGLGSMGKRRLKLLKEGYPKLQLIGVDTSLERRNEAKELFKIEAYDTIEEAIKNGDPSIAFICTAPLTHNKLIKLCLSNNLHIFTELNLVSDGYDELIKLASDNNKELFISSTLLYRKDLQYICEKIQGNKVNYCYHVGQYLPDWHPWENYKDFFVGDKRTNGCREIFAIDLPWIIKAFGDIESYTIMKDKNSDLDINYDDNYIITLKHKNGNKGVICVDVISRKAVRVLEVYSEKLHLFWEGSPNTLFQYDLESKEKIQIATYSSIDKDKNYSDNIIENAYLDEIYTFFGILEGSSYPLYTFAEDKKILAFIDKIEGV